MSYYSYQPQMASTAIAIAEMMSGAAGRIAAIRTRGAETRAQMTMDASRTIADVMTKAADRAAQLFIERNRLALEYARLAAAKENSRGGGGGGGGRVREGTNQWDLMVAYARGEVDLEIAKGRTAAELAAKTMDIAAESERLEAANATANRKIDVDAAIEQDKLDVEWERGNAALVAAGKESRGPRKEYMAAQAAKTDAAEVPEFPRESTGFVITNGKVVSPRTGREYAARVKVPIGGTGRGKVTHEVIGDVRSDELPANDDVGDLAAMARVKAIRDNAKTFDIIVEEADGTRHAQKVVNDKHVAFLSPGDKAARAKMFDAYDGAVKQGQWRSATEQFLEFVDSEAFVEASNERAKIVANEVAKEAARGLTSGGGSGSIELPVGRDGKGNVVKQRVVVRNDDVFDFESGEIRPDVVDRALAGSDTVGKPFDPSAAVWFDPGKSAQALAAVRANLALAGQVTSMVTQQQASMALMSNFVAAAEGEVRVDTTLSDAVALINEAEETRRLDELAARQVPGAGEGAAVGTPGKRPPNSVEMQARRDIEAQAKADKDRWDADKKARREAAARREAEASAAAAASATPAEVTVAPTPAPAPAPTDEE